MGAEKGFWQTITLLGVLLSVAVPAYVAYDLHSKGTAVEKRVELQKFTLIDPMEDLSALGDKVALSLRIGNQTTDNLLIAKMRLRNTGTVPILPSEYHENFSINVHKPWKILAVENEKDAFRCIEFKWNRISETRFEAEPALLNPGDRVSTHIYITNTQSEKLSTRDRLSARIVECKARIVNLRDFTKPPDMFRLTSRRFFWISVDLEGWALPFVILASMFFLALYLHLLYRIGLLQSMQLPAILLVLGANFLSLATAESMATYFFGSTMTRLFGINHWVNAPWIILNAAMVMILYWKAQKKTVKAESQDGIRS